MGELSILLLISSSEPPPNMLHLFYLFLVYTGAGAALQCTQVPGKLKQVDAGNGAVYGVSDDGNIYRWSSNTWVQVPGQLIHVSVGPAGVWGVNKDNTIFKLLDGNWKTIAGSLKQVDAGGDKFLAGVNRLDSIYCLNEEPTLSTDPAPTFTLLEGGLKYYSCGPRGCWGVSSINEIFYRYDVKPNACQGSKWQQIEGSLVMVEVGTNGSVYGVNAEGKVYKREGICADKLTGSSWTPVDLCSRYKHVSVDAGTLWLLTEKGDIFKCEI